MFCRPIDAYPAGPAKAKLAILDLSQRNNETNGYLYASKQMAAVAGVPYQVTTSVSKAAQCEVIMLSHYLDDNTFSPAERGRLLAYVRNGGVLLGSDVKDAKAFYNLFGIQDAQSSNKHFRLRFLTGKDTTLFQYFNHPREKTISLGDSTGARAVYASHYTTRGEPLAYLGGDPDKPAFTRHQFQSGYAYAMGISFRDLVLRPMLNKDFSAERVSSNGFEPSAGMMGLLLRSLCARHMDALVWKHTSPGRSLNTVMVTHDVDSRTGFDTMGYFARSEYQQGIRANYNITTRYFEDDINKLLSQHSEDGAKIQAIFNYVRSHIKWNGDSRLYCSEKLKRIYDDGIGNSADINLMLTSMLRYAGFNANPILVSTISHGVPNTYPARTHYNYVISGVEFGNGKVLKLDASSRLTKLGQLPYRCLNWNGRLIRRNGTTKQVSLNPEKSSKINYSINMKLHKGGKLTGKVRKQFTEQQAYIYRSKINNLNQETYINTMKNDLDVDVLEYGKENVEKLEKPVLETFSFTKENGFDQINDKIYFSPLSFLATKENPFKQNREERNFPINFTYPRTQRVMINVDIPEEYTIEYMPEKIALALPEKTGLFKYNIDQSPDGDIQIIVQKEINQSIFAPDFYQTLKQFFTKVVEKETDKIVLTKT